MGLFNDPDIPDQGWAKLSLLRRLRSRLAPRQRLKQLSDYFSLVRPPIETRNGALFIGYAEGDLGLGQGFRNDLQAVAQYSLPFAIYPFRVGIEGRLIGPFMPERYDVTHAYPVNVIQVAPDHTQLVLRTLDRRLYRNSYNILRTFWELPKAPKAWRSMLSGIHEIWAPNTFVANAFRDIFRGPITLIPHTVNIETEPYPNRDQLGIECGRFYFLFNFDYNSSPFRKNPLGVIEAFRSAFPHGTENVGLIVKSLGAPGQYTEIRRAISKAASLDKRILVIDKSLSRRNVLGLIFASDAYVSLHRSEGFGSGMAEAMSFGRIVIGTNFSGNTDFLTTETGFPIPFTLRPVAAHEYPWGEGQNWAEPDLDAAVSTMRLVVQSPELARSRARNGQRLVRANYAPATVGRIIKERLAELITI